MKHPLLIPVICHACGIAVGWYTNIPLTLLWCGVFFILGTSVLDQTRRAFWLLLLCAGLAWLQTAMRVNPYSPNDLRLRVGEQPALVFLTGKIVGGAELQSPEQFDTQAPRWRAHLDVSSIQALSAKQKAVPAQGRVLVFGEGHLHTNLLPGTQVRVAGVIARPATARAPGIFDYREKLRREGIHYQLDTASESDWQVLQRPASAPWSTRFRQWARERFAAGLPAEDQSLRLLWAMVLGWRTALTDEVAEPFMRSGTMHIFAISGLHIALISGILVTLLRVCRLGRLWCGLIVIPILWFYCAATGFQASATRATLMMSIVIGGWALERPTNLLNSTCAAAFIILLWDPLQLMQASFQLSFSVVFTIAILIPKLTSWGDRLIHLDPLRPESETSRSLKFGVWLGRQSWSLVSISVAAWLGSMPLIAHYFHLWTPGALLANPIVVLLATAAIGSAIGALLMSLICPPLAELFNHGAWFWVHSQASISEITSTLPGSWWRVSQTSLLEVTIAYLLLFAWGSDRFRYRRLKFISAITLSTMIAFAGVSRLEQGNRTELAVFSDNSNAIFWNPPGDQDDLLIDCGRSNAFERLVLPFLHNRGASQVDNILLTHGDINHVEAFDLARATLNPAGVALSSVSQRSPTYNRIVESLVENNRQIIVRNNLTNGATTGSWKVIHPPATEGFRSADDAVVVLSSTIEGWRVLLLSDASPRVQQKLLKQERNLNCDLIVLGISDPESVLSDSFLRACQPKLIIVQDNLTPVEDRLWPAQIPENTNRIPTILRTSQNGTILLCFRPDTVEIETANKPNRRIQKN